MELITFI